MVKSGGDLLRAAVKRIRETAFSKYGKLIPREEWGVLSTALDRLLSERLESLAELPSDTLDETIQAVLDAYISALGHESIVSEQRRLKRSFEKLIKYANLLRILFASDVFEVPDANAWWMTRADREQFVERLEQAIVMITLAGNVVDKQIAATPTTRKKRGLQGARALFELHLTEFFERKFGKPHDSLVADLANVLFDLGPEAVAYAGSTQSLRRRWRVRRKPEPELLIDFEPLEREIRAALANKPLER